MTLAKGPPKSDLAAAIFTSTLVSIPSCMQSLGGKACVGGPRVPRIHKRDKAEPIAHNTGDGNAGQKSNEEDQ